MIQSSCKWTLLIPLCKYTVNTKYLYNICTMLDQHRRRWADVVHVLQMFFYLLGNYTQLMQTRMLCRYRQLNNPSPALLSVKQ